MNIDEIKAINLKAKQYNDLRNQHLGEKKAARASFETEADLYNARYGTQIDDSNVEAEYLAVGKQLVEDATKVSQLIQDIENGEFEKTNSEADNKRTPMIAVLQTDVPPVISPATHTIQPVTEIVGTERVVTEIDFAPLPVQETPKDIEVPQTTSIPVVTQQATAPIVKTVVTPTVAPHISTEQNKPKSQIPFPGFGTDTAVVEKLDPTFNGFLLDEARGDEPAVKPVNWGLQQGDAPTTVGTLFNLGGK